MPLGFGFSIGDFIAGIKLLKNAYEALSDTRGAIADYTALRETIDDLEKALCAASKYKSPQHQAAVEEQFESLKVVQESKSDIEDLVKQVATGLKVQDDLVKETKTTQDEHFRAMSTMATSVETCNRSVAPLTDQLKEIQKSLQECAEGEKDLQVHLTEIKTMIHVQQELPSQVLLRRPVVLIDAFEGNRLPFHLEFINCFEALFSVLSIRFNDKGDPAIQRIRRQMFILYEHSKQRQVDMAGQWSNAFKYRMSDELPLDKRVCSSAAFSPPNSDAATATPRHHVVQSRRHR
ncbi:hypothetical protein BKA63DRAFT_537293 [Paraphoma chrysanthemicola]|nr:hypothetical protein BKA63DRAFT_537293 [Paraphoma chrysanthemicola]